MQQKWKMYVYIINIYYIIKYCIMYSVILLFYYLDTNVGKIFFGSTKIWDSFSKALIYCCKLLFKIR